MTKADETTPDELARALAGDRALARALLARLVPVVRVHVTRVLWRYRGLARKRDFTQEADDLAQDVLVQLFDNGGRVLKTWDPARGLSLVGFVGLVAERSAAGSLKSGARTPWHDDPTAPDDLPQSREGERSIADLLASRDLAERVYVALKAELSPLGVTLFRELYLDEHDVDQICASHTMTRDAVYAWRSRLGRRLRELAEQLTESVRVTTMARTA